MRKLEPLAFEKMEKAQKGLIPGAESGIFNYKPVVGKDLSVFQAQSDDVFGKLSDDQRGSVTGYTKAEYLNVNERLRDGTWEKHKYTAESVRDIDAAMDRFDLKDDVMAFRGDAARYYSDWKVGDVKEYNAYMSTSFSKDVAQEFADNVRGKPIIVEVNMPRGTRGIYIGTNSGMFADNSIDEAEFLIGRGQKFKVIERTKDVLRLEAVRG